MMRKYLSFLFLIISFYNSKAQKESVLLYGDIGYESNKRDDNSAKQFTFSPGLGYQFNEHWTIGVTSNFAKLKYEGIYNQEGTVYTVGPFIRYTRNLSPIFSFFGQLEGGISGGS